MFDPGPLAQGAVLLDDAPVDGLARAHQQRVGVLSGVDQLVLAGAGAPDQRDVKIGDSGGKVPLQLESMGLVAVAVGCDDDLDLAGACTLLGGRFGHPCAMAPRLSGSTRHTRTTPASDHCRYYRTGRASA